MKAMLLEKAAAVDKGPLKMVELPEPEPGPGQVRIKISVCGVCHTDLHIVEGDLVLPRVPLVPGHEIIGVVDKLGEGVRKDITGRRVGVPWLYDTCGKCEFCVKGKENLCTNARFTGFHVDGGYAGYVVVPEDSAYPLPPGLGDAAAAPLMCGGVIGYRSLVLTGAGRGDVLGLYGFGNSAHVTIQVARFLGIKVFVFSRTRENLELARTLGAEWAGNAEEAPPTLLDAGIVFAPSGPLVPAALEHLKPGGTLALAGITMTDIPKMKYETIYGERTLRSVANSTHQDVKELLDYAGRIPLRTEVSLFDLADANEALLAVKESRIRGGAVLRCS